MCLMKKSVTLTIALFAGWALAMLTVALYGQYRGLEEYGISAHLLLMFTGLPSSWVSWSFPHASLVAILVAGIAGCVQWALIVWLYSRSKNGRKAH